MFPSTGKNPSAEHLVWFFSECLPTETIYIQCFSAQNQDSRVETQQMKWRNIEEDIEAFQANHLLCENANSGQITFGFGWMLINFDNELLAMLSSLI